MTCRAKASRLISRNPFEDSDLRVVHRLLRMLVCSGMSRRAKGIDAEFEARRAAVASGDTLPRGGTAALIGMGKESLKSFERRKLLSLITNRIYT